MAWWAKNSTKFPKLAKLARKYLGSALTSVPSERVFSTVELICNRKISLLGMTAEKLCFLNYNLGNGPTRCRQLDARQTQCRRHRSVPDPQFETVELWLLNGKQLLALGCLFGVVAIL